MKLFLLLLLLGILELQAIITIAPIKLGEKPGWSGKVEGSFETKRGNTDKDEYTLGVKMQYDNNLSYVIFTDLIGSYGEASGERNTNKTYAHLRFIHNIISYIDYEIFLQSETNEFTSIEKRRLGGAGLRFKLLKSSYGDIYFGLGLYDEGIHYSKEIDPGENNIRINSYLAYVIEFTPTAKLAYVGYYQPKAEDFEDIITSNALELQVAIYGNLSLKFKLYYDYDSQPAIGRETTDFTQVTSFSYEF